MTDDVTPTDLRALAEDGLTHHRPDMPEYVVCRGLLDALDQVEQLSTTVDELRRSHHAEGTYVCTCRSYPHLPNCGLDERLVTLRAEIEALTRENNRCG